MEQFVDNLGRLKVVCIVTDDASNMKKARKDLVGQPAYTHITEMRSVMGCMGMLAAWQPWPLQARLLQQDMGCTAGAGSTPLAWSWARSCSSLA
jgi:hypothetical protein